MTFEAALLMVISFELILIFYRMGQRGDRMKLIDADKIIYESIDSSDAEEYFAKYGTGILAVRKEDIDAMQEVEKKDVVHIIFETLSECGIYGEEATIKLIGTLKRLREYNLLPPCMR